jgi:hypothetical protein
MREVTLVDETTIGSRADAWLLQVAEERLTLRELIRRRVFQEVAEYHARPGGAFQCLVRPTDAEATLALTATASKPRASATTRPGRTAGRAAGSWNTGRRTASAS